MNTITVTNRSKALKDLLALAEQSDVLLQTADGTQFILSRLTSVESFQIGKSDELADEIKVSRQNRALMEFLNERGKRAKSQRRTSLAEARRQLQV